MSSIKAKGGGSHPFIAQNLEKAMGRIRSARPGDLVFDAPSQASIPRSRKYRRGRLGRKNLMDKSALLYGTHKKTPYYNNIVIKDKALGWEMAVDEVSRLNERIGKRREFRFFIESYITLSRRFRRRSWKMILFPPLSLEVDPGSFKDSRRHQEHMATRSAHVGHYVCKVQGLLAEDNREELEEYDPGLIDDDHKWSTIQNLSVGLDGFLRKMEDLADGKLGGVDYGRFTPNGDVMIRLGLDSSFGIVFDRSSLLTDSGRDMVQSWLQDIYEFTSGPKRRYYYDETVKAYRQISANDPLPPPNAVHAVLDALEKNLKPRVPLE